MRRPAAVARCNPGSGSDGCNLTSMRKVVAGLAGAVTAVMLVRKVFFEGEYLTAAAWSLLLLWIAHPSGHRAYLDRRSRGIPPGETGFNWFSKAIFGAMLALTAVMLYQRMS